MLRDRIKSASQQRSIVREEFIAHELGTDPETEKTFQWYVKRLNGHEISQMQMVGEAYVKEINKKLTILENALLLGLFASCDETGERVFEDADLDMLLSWEAPLLRRFTQKINKLNGLDTSIQQIAKKSLSRQNKNSGTN
jgi:hypothetical protein